MDIERKENVEKGREDVIVLWVWEGGTHIFDFRRDERVLVQLNFFLF